MSSAHCPSIASGWLSQSELAGEGIPSGKVLSSKPLGGFGGVDTPVAVKFRIAPPSQHSFASSLTLVASHSRMEHSP
jgi:hypothetical protein